jgi:signal transduction histidine kinase
MSSPKRSARGGIAGRLFAAQTLVVLVGGLTLGLVAGAIGPAIFHDHLRRVPGGVDEQTARHVEEAYVSANAISLGVALAVALVAALAVSAYVARRVARPVSELAGAAAEIAEGHFGPRVSSARLGQEFDSLAASFNAMAGRLADVETTRRRLLADVGHELRTPVATIEAYVDAAEDGVAVAGEDTWSVLRTQTRRLRRLAEDITAVSRAEEHKLDLQIRRLEAGNVASSAAAAASPRAGAKGVQLLVHVSEANLDIDADPERIGQVLTNLLDNAVRHTPPGGKISLTVQRTPDAIRLAVADTGEGISAEHLPHIFERFYRVDPNDDGGGSGIGLAVARAIVELHKGRIEATSDGPATGATFTVTMPPAKNTAAGRS